MNDINNLMDKIKELKGVRFNKNVAELIGIEASAMAVHIKRETIPLKKLVIWCHKNGYDIGHFLFTSISVDPNMRRA